MRTKIHVNNEQFILGTTLKDPQALENNNMALHACANTVDVLENRKNLAAFLGYQLEDFVCANQTHSDNFYRVRLQDKGKGAACLETAIQDTDALYTYEPNIILSSFTADCVPVIFYNETNGLVGVIHSGWQGTVKEITLHFFRHLIEEEQCNPDDFRVYIGTALSQEKFEVDEDVYRKFLALGYAEDFMYYNAESKKYHIDNQKTVKRQCELAGILNEHITVDPTCTFINEAGFSYRQDRKAGRHLNFIVRKKSSRRE